MSRKPEKDLLHLTIIGAVLISFGASFDAWWHVSVGRDSFFVLPHLFVHAGVLIMLATSFWTWRKQAHAAWRKIFLTTLLIPLSLPFDEIWHYFRGKETVDSIWIIWSPPHVLLFVAAIAAMLFVTRMLHRRENMAAKQLFGALLLAALLNLIFILAGPLFPFSPFAIAGIYGAAVTTFIMSWIFFYAQRLLPHIAPAFLVAVFSVILQSTIADSGVVYGSRAIGSFPYLPSWILVLSQIMTALVIDTKFIKSYTLRGLVAGTVGGLLLYALSLHFIDPLYQYSSVAALGAAFCAGIGGAVGGFLHINRNHL